MQQVHQQQSPSKNNNGCFRCHQLGHWANNCPQSPNFRSPNRNNQSPISLPSSSSDYPRTHCRCGAGICEIRVSNSEKNPNRCYYCCPGKFEYYCEYFKWCDMFKKEEILKVQPKPYPICACGAGVCSVTIEESGPNAGLRYFVCPIKKGYGACNFRQEIPLVEDQELDYLSLEEARAIDAAVMCALDFSSEDVCMESEMDGSSDVAVGMSSGSPVLHLHSLTNNTCENTLAPGLTAENNELHHHSVTNNNSDNTLSMELTAENDELLLEVNNSDVDNVKASVGTVVATFQNPTSRGFNPLNILDEETPSEGSLNLDEFLPKPPLLKDNIVDALEKLSLCLQKDFITLSNSVSPKDQENVMKGRSTFAPVDYLRVDYGLFHLQVIEYIKQATAHACIEQAINDDATSRVILDHYNKEKARFEEIFRSFCEAMKAYMASNDRLISFRKKVFGVKNILTELEEEEWCCEVENAGCKQNLLHITKNLSECKESMQAAYQEIEDALKLLKSG